MIVDNPISFNILQKSTPVWLRLSILEFWKQFVSKKSPGGRDFVWLTVLLSLLLSFALLVMGSREGISEQLVDLLIGRVPGHGIPIWVRANPFSEGGQKLINHTIITQVNQSFKNQGIKIYPYQEVDGVLINLLDKNIWKSLQHDVDLPEFEGIAVAQDDPLWQYGFVQTNQKVNSPCVILNHYIFNKYFDYEHYQSVLQKHLPKPLIDSLPTRELFFDQRKPSIFWLCLGHTKTLVPVHRVWMDRIPVPGNYSFLVNLELYHSLTYAHQYPSIEFFPECQIDASTYRIQSLMVQRDVTIAQRKQFEDCMKLPLVRQRANYYMRSETPMPQFMVNACIDFAQLTDQQVRIAERVKGDIIRQVSYDTLLLPAHKMPSFHSNSTNQLNQGLVEEKISGYPRAFVYVQDRQVLGETVMGLTQLDQQPLLIPWIYKDALRRFGALIKLFDMLGTPYIILFYSFLIALLGVQTAGLVTHRKQIYGIFLSKGMPRRFIYYMLNSQIGLSVFIGIMIAISLIGLVRYWFYFEIVNMLVLYNDVLIKNTPDILPLSLNDYIIVLVTGLVCAWSLSGFILFMMPLRQSTMPDDLLTS